jgi:hypothetical protein
MAVPLLIWTYGKRYQIGDAYESFGREVWRLPTTIKAFYGFNFILGVIFLFPILTPIISLFGGYFIAVYLFGWREEGRLISKQRKARILALIYLPLPLLVVIGFFFGYTLGEESGILYFLSEFLFHWTNNIDKLYTSALILADSATIGGVIYLIYEGAQQVDRTVKIPEALITIISFSCFLVLETVFLIYGEVFAEFLGWIHIIIVILGIIMLIIRYGKGLMTSRDTSIMGWLTLVIFQIVNFAAGELETISQTTAIFLAFAIFLFLYANAYQKASKRY